MDTRSRIAVGTTCPGSDPAALRVITVAVLAGLVVSGIVVISRHPAGSLGGAAAAMEQQAAPSGLSRPPERSTASLRLLSQAARACHTMTYQGVEMLGGWSAAGPATSVVDVWHAPGGVTLAQAVAPAPHWSGEVPHIVAACPLPGRPGPGGQRHAGHEPAAGRPAQRQLPGGRRGLGTGGGPPGAGGHRAAATAGSPPGSGWTRPRRCRCAGRRSTGTATWSAMPPSWR